MTESNIGVTLMVTTELIGNPGSLLQPAFSLVLAMRGRSGKGEV